ncbi:MAG: CDP-alcohol phosphatidyltransferase family protein [Vampirovibrionales bacterium]|nr:CDP-alcohol phosphatidyltransferase family protein [Vampirovibrionales bacterium]
MNMPLNPRIKPDLGLYQTKYILRRLLRKIPGVGSLSPNGLSLLAIVPGLLAAWCLYRGYWLGAILSIASRMLVNTLDGLVAEEFDKKSNLGSYLNRLPGELTDILMAFGLWSYSAWPWNVMLIMLCGWVQILGILELTAGGQPNPWGPVGKPIDLPL